MKKVILILILFLSCYFIYNKTLDEKLYYVTIGDFLSKGINYNGTSSYGYSDYIEYYLKKNRILKGYNNTFTSIDYRIIDIIKILEYNEKKDNLSLNYLIKRADIITLSLGMNELYYKLNRDTQNIYTYIDDMINNYDKILSYINSFHHKKVFILGYYNILGKNNDIFNYANYKLKKLCNNYEYIYIDLSKIFNNNPTYINIDNSFIPNQEGYEKISQIIIDKFENNWYNILRNFITMTQLSWRKERNYEKKYSSKLCRINCYLCMW